VSDEIPNIRVLLVHKHFWPDVAPYGQMLRTLAAEYASRHWQVSVFTAQPSYHGIGSDTQQPASERMEGFEVVRVWLLPDEKKGPFRRLFNAVLFAARLVMHCTMVRRYDVITVTTMPPVIMGMAARLIRKLAGTSYIYHCQDLHPEAAEAGGVLREGFITSIMRRIDNENCRRAGAVVVLSEDMRVTLADRGLDTTNVHVIRNFNIVSTEQAVDVNLPIGKEKDEFRVLFAGNIGRFQGLESVVKAAPALLSSPNIHVLFMGAGGALERLKALARELEAENVSFLPHQPADIALRVAAESDLGIVSIRSGIYRCAFPSKLAMYLEAGCRVLTIVEPESQLSKIVLQADVGTTCDPGDEQGIVRSIREEHERWRCGGIDRGRIQSIGRDYFGLSEIMPSWIRLVSEVALSSKT
jgi:glycosyltransferase involved in cell wall biosynthesis